MTSFFPDLNVWVALSVSQHPHSKEAWRWMRLLPEGATLLFSRYTQVGLLRLLSNPAVMGAQTVTLGRAWDIYEQWLRDPRVEFHPEPSGLGAAFRQATGPFHKQQAWKWVGDCYLLAYAQGCGARLVTFDKALVEAARKQGHRAIVPS